jgi:serine protease AprX
MKSLFRSYLTPRSTRRIIKNLAVPFAIAFTAFGGTVSPQLNSMDPNRQVQVIVQHSSSLLGTLLSTVCSLTNLLEILPGGELCSTTVAGAMSMANNPMVAHISVNNTLQGTGSGSSLPVYDYTPQTIQPVSALSGSTNSSAGSNVGVAIIDSGIHINHDLIGNGTSGLLASLFPQVVYAESFVPTEGVDDYYGHGTHIAGIIAGNGTNSSGPAFLDQIHGIAPGAHLISLKVLDRNGVSSDAQVIKAIDRAIELKDIYNIRVINISLGRPIYESYKTDPLCQEVEKAWLSGITVVVAAGNAGRDNSANTLGYATIAAPGNDPLAITVGAMNTEGTAQRSDDLMTTYSSKGPSLGDHIVKPDLVAPGNRIFSILDPGATLPTAESANVVPLASYVKSPSSGQTSSYFILNGTSMAAGVTSGAAAVLLAQQNLTPDQVKARLMKTATKTFPQNSVITDPTSGQTFTIQYDIFTVGAGYLDLDAALASHDTIPAQMNAASPVAILVGADANGQSAVHVINDMSQSTVWGSSMVWGSSAVWGSAAVWGSSAWNGDSTVWGSSLVWGSSIVWGSSTDSGYSTVWGSSLVWGSSTVSGSSLVWGSSTIQGIGFNGDPNSGGR